MVGLLCLVNLTEGLSKAKKAIEMVNEKAHIANLTDLIKDMLDGKDES